MIGNASSQHLDYNAFSRYDHFTKNQAGNILIDVDNSRCIRVYVSNGNFVKRVNADFTIGTFDRLACYEFMFNIVPGFIVCRVIGCFYGVGIGAAAPIDCILMYYVAGLAVGRVASIVVEPLCNYFGIVEFADYMDYVEASEKEPFIKNLSNINNLYRNLTTVSLILTICALLKGNWNDNSCSIAIVCGIGLLLFLIAYRKQTEYIKRRVYMVLQKNTI